MSRSTLFRRIRYAEGLARVYGVKDSKAEAFLNLWEAVLDHFLEQGLDPFEEFRKRFEPEIGEIWFDELEEPE